MLALREKNHALVGLALVAVLCWAWLVPAALDMQGGMRGLAAWMMPARWDATYAALIFAMWAVMMIAMMLPSTVPTALLYERVARSDLRAADPTLRAGFFASGYLVVWCGYALAATALQWALSASNLLTPMMRTRGHLLAAALLIVAGVWQWTPLKRRCLQRCRDPAAFIASEWRAGTGGAWRMGVRLGLSCLGCCWAMMLLLFVGGVMNLVWIVAISLGVLLEKFLPDGAPGGRAFGAALIVAGALLLVF
jgi:predicted metal-binding membrane protein